MKLLAFAGLFAWSLFAFVMVLAGQWTVVPLVVGGWILLVLYGISQAFYWPPRR